MTRPARNIAASVRARLLTLARDQRQDFQRILERYAIERILYRLSISPEREQFILKGAQLLTLWGENLTRPTRDLDLLGLGDCEPEALRNRFARILAVSEPDDGLVFLPDTLNAGVIRETTLYGGVRLTFSAVLDKARIPVQIDVGIGDAVAPRETEFPVLLDHPLPRLLGYPREGVVAEKFHAAVMLGEINSRMKDFHDLHQLAGTFPFAGAELSSALVATFMRRQTPFTEETPSCLRKLFYSHPDRQRAWRAWQDKQQFLNPENDLSRIGERLIAFLRPLHAALTANETFNARWQRGGPWR